jgi:hypothetical protein
MSDKPRSPIDRAFQRGKAVGIAWYREADYLEIIRIMDDAQNFNPTFAGWEEKMRRRESELNASGISTIRAIIDPKAFPGWCALRGLKVDSYARQRFAAEYAARDIDI